MIPNEAKFTSGSRRIGTGTLKSESTIKIVEFVRLGLTFSADDFMYQIAYKAAMLR